VALALAKERNIPMTECYVCPHRCGVERSESISTPGGSYGSCGCGMLPIVARAALHMWEEPCISGTKGSGAVFFSGCNLHCCFCQNYEISRFNKGKEITVARLQEIYQELIKQGAHNINLVTPTHFAVAILKSLEKPLPVPVVYNTSGFEALDTLRKFKGKVQIYLPDLKYSDDLLAIKYSNAPSYFRIATEAIKEMYKQTGPYKLDKDGIMESGVIIRHLILPSHLENSKKVIDWVAENFKPGQVMFSLMHQYVPCGNAAKYPEINRTLTPEEYQEMEDYLFASGIEDGFVQEGEAASGDFIPKFDGTGV
jgi:putative pyruvate formate lyase activating enzyme